MYLINCGSNERIIRGDSIAVGETERWMDEDGWKLVLLHYILYARVNGGEMDNLQPPVWMYNSGSLSKKTCPRLYNIVII